MILAISSQGPTLESMVDPRFGRAPYFIIYDTETDDFKAVNNSENVNAMQGAGVQASQAVVSHKPDIVISGNFGPKAFQVLNSSGAKTALWSEGKVSEAIELARTNQLEFTHSANVEGHWQ
jgi:predicted Fe-Mo cluster-binding NifX family protein